MNALTAGLLVSVCGASACVLSEDDNDSADVTVSDSKSDAAAQINVTAGASTTISFTAPAFPVELSVDCAPSANPDIVGTQFTITSAALGISSASPAYAAYWRWSGEATPGPGTLKVTGTSGSSACVVRMRRVAGECTASTTTRSPAVGHEHLRVGTNVTTWGNFPASGNHWGAWAPWDTVYTKPVKRGFYLHNLEHGGLVLSYGCSSPTESPECADAAADLTAVKDAFGDARVLVTPDPEQPTMYGARGWRMGFASECFNDDQLLQFMGDNFRQGREDVDADPPRAYDPTTLTVPCVNIIAAPDSCP